MSFRRSGGNSSGGNRGQNRSFNSQSSVSPWQGSAMNQGGGFLSQLTTNPQQLALALTTLLQPQVQSPPSLMNVNSSGMSRGGNFDRFNNRGRDNRRHEPYNKNRGGNWGNRNRNRNKKEDKKKDDKEEKKDIKKDKDADQSMDEEDKKRDWKDEKKSTEDDEDGNETKDGEKGSKEGKFFKIPPQFLTCFVCNKQMWDGESMEKHLRGRAHSEMIKALEESIGITVGILRENMRLTEERNIIELFRIQRTKKFNKFRGPEESCNMCDLRFRGKMSTHRRSEGHQRLKRYLHPRCHTCSKEFHARIEWIEHRLTPDHLRKYCQKLEEAAAPIDGAVVITNSDEQDAMEISLDKLLIEPLQMENENAITELDDDNLDNLQNRYPSYKNDRPLATKALKEFSGFVCELCNRSFTNDGDAQNHLTTQRHYYKFIEALKEKWDQKEKKEREEREEAERKEKEEKEKAENGGEEGDADREQEMEDTMNDSAMETADETLNSSQEDATMEDSQVSQEGEAVEEEYEKEEEVQEDLVEEKKSKKGKPGPTSKKTATSTKPTPPAPVKTPTNASPAARGRKAQ